MNLRSFVRRWNACIEFWSEVKLHYVMCKSCAWYLILFETVLQKFLWHKYMHPVIIMSPILWINTNKYWNDFVGVFLVKLFWGMKVYILVTKAYKRLDLTWTVKFLFSQMRPIPCCKRLVFYPALKWKLHKHERSLLNF